MHNQAFPNGNPDQLNPSPSLDSVPNTPGPGCPSNIILPTSAKRSEAYFEFLKTKQRRRVESGFDALVLNPALFDFQKYIVTRALKAGRYAIFADCGLGKTIMQLEWARHVAEHTSNPVLILAPLAVSGQTIREGERFGYLVNRISDGVFQDVPGIYITNYDQLDNVDCGAFAGVVLDESSILKNFEGKTRNAIIQNFQNTPYKLACTATPSPNDPMELGNHAEFLNVMSRNEMLSMYFVHDGGETAKWRLKGHAIKDFWRFVSTWSVMLNKPADIGYPMAGFDLPPLNLIEKQIKTPKRDNGRLFNDTAVSATDFNLELRSTRQERMHLAAEIVNASAENFIVWVKQDGEADLLKKLIPGAVEVRGSDKREVKEERLLGFANNEFRVLITKSKIAQFGLNFQNCHNQVFASLDFSFEALYQSIRRSYRFLQKEPVNIYLITTDTMQNVIESVRRKKEDFESMQNHMTAACNLDVLKESTVMNKLKDCLEYLSDQEFESENCVIKRGDCVQLIKSIPDESIGFSIFSPPFAELYTYSDSIEDMGNSKDYQEFLTAFRFLVDDLFRVMWRGRNVAVHCMDLPIQKGKEGFIGLRDFSNMIRSVFEGAGFIYHSRVTIWKNPVTEMQRTKALGLLHKQVKKDAAMSRVGLPDYLLVFRKPGDSDHPIKCNITVDTWQMWASPIWDDIDYGKTLNGRAGRGEQDEKHICPLQLDTIERAMSLWSNPGDLVYTPFAGVGSELFEAIRLGRRGVGHELKQSYFDLAVKNIQAAEAARNQQKLF